MEGRDVAEVLVSGSFHSARVCPRSNGARAYGTPPLFFIVGIDTFRVLVRIQTLPHGDNVEWSTVPLAVTPPRFFQGEDGSRPFLSGTV